MTVHLGGARHDIRPLPEPRPGKGGTAVWLAQASTGVLLVLLLGVHIVAQHFVVSGGLRDYAQVVSFIANPFVLALECVFLVVVIWHALLGVRAVLFDFGPSRRAGAVITRVLVGLGVVTAAYGFWLIATIAAKG